MQRRTRYALPLTAATRLCARGEMRAGGPLPAVVAALLCSVLVLALGLPAAAQVPPESLGSPDLPGQEVLTGARYLDEEFTYSQTHRDVVYGGNRTHQGQWLDLLLDVYEPDNDEEFRPAVIAVHGGGFANGSKDWDLEGWGGAWMGGLLARRGYVVVPINYRLRPDVFTGGGVSDYTDNLQALLLEVPEAARDGIEDAKAAVRWVRANAAALRIDPGRIAISGASAGGFVSLGVAFSGEEPGDSGTPGWDSHVAAAIAMTGAYGPVVIGRPILPGDPPIAFHHALNDFDVPVLGTLSPCLNTRAMGNVCEAYIYPYEAGTWHHWHGLRRHTELVGARNASFLYRHMISKERTVSEFTDLEAATRGDEATVTGRLRTEDGGPLVAERVQARNVHGEWFETTTGPDGVFELTVSVPDHGRMTDVHLRYDGRSSPSWLLDDHIAPTHDTVTATWGKAPT